MNRSVVGLYACPLREPDRASGGLGAKFRWAIWYKANPRDEAYMRALFAEQYPAGHFIDMDATTDWPTHIGDARTIILLYPDAIGLGFAATENIARAALRDGAALRVLNGRRRSFLLNASTQRALRRRRWLERWMVGEILFSGLFLAVTPFMLLTDLARGRR